MPTDPTEPRRSRRKSVAPAKAAEAGKAEGSGGSGRIAVRKTYKLYVGGAFPRSESGRSYVVNDVAGTFLANAALGSRKDVRDAVVAARKAFAGWSGRTPYNRGQILYRIAEMLEGRRGQFVEEVHASEGGSRDRAAAIVDEAVDRWVWYAGWADKLAQVVGSSNPVSGPYFDFSVPEPTGVVGIVAPQESALLGLVSVVAPAIVSGNTCVVIASTARPLPAISFAEVLATSDLPGGVVNLLTGSVAELAPWLASHQDVDGLDLSGVGVPGGDGRGGGGDGRGDSRGDGAGDAGLAVELEVAAAEHLARVVRPKPDLDWSDAPGLESITAFLETKTVWHPVGI